jgi:hypothetical protein
MPGPVKELFAMALECRTLAAAAKHPEIREQLLDVAEQIDRLARHRVFAEIMTARPPKQRGAD